jgi:hypothetical protein
MSDKDGKSLVGKLNIYTCEKCRGHIVTVDRDEGTTPFMVGCRATEGCSGMMESSFYRVWDQRMAPQFEWYRPDATEVATLKLVARDHVQRGGLLLRALDKAGE